MNQNLIGPRFCSSNQSHFWTIWDLLQSLRSAPGLQAPGATLPPALHEWVCPSCVHPLIGLCLEKHPCEDSMPWPFAQTPACSADFRALSVWPEHTLCGGTQDWGSWGSWGCLSYKERGEANGPLGHWRVIGERKPPLEWAAWKSIVLSLLGGGPCSTAYGILAAWPGIEPMLTAVDVWSLNHWTTREVLYFFNLKRAFLLTEWQYFQKF